MLAISIFLILPVSEALAQEFNATYTAYLTSNGDIHVVQKPMIVLIHGDIVTPIMITSQIESFALYKTGSSYTRYAKPPVFDPASARELTIVMGDFNQDGLMDVRVVGIGSGSPDQTILAGGTIQIIGVISKPTGLTAQYSRHPPGLLITWEKTSLASSYELARSLDGTNWDENYYAGSDNFF